MDLKDGILLAAQSPSDFDRSAGERDRERERDRSRRAERGTRFSDADPIASSNSNGGSRDRSRESRRTRRIYVSNIPYEYRWQDLKDLFRRVIGHVEFVELFVDENHKPRGCGIVEFKDPDSVQKAMDTMNRYEINGREIVVKEDHGEQRDQYGRIVRSNDGGGSNSNHGGSSRGFRHDRDDDRMGSRGLGGNSNIGGMNLGNLGGSDMDQSYNTYGLSTSFLESLGIQGPLHTKVFVANLDYKVDTKKLKQVFKLAGKVISVDLSTDKEGNSRGFAVIEYDHPVEAVQAISMLDRQMLFDRRMTVRLDRVPDKNEGLKLPEGLGGIGIGLGPNGEPLRDVARNLPNMQQSNMSTMNMLNTNPAPVPVAPPLNGPSSILGPVPNTANIAGLNTNLLNNVVGLSNLSALSNPLLSSAAASLNTLGLNLGGSGGSASGVGSVASGNDLSQISNAVNSSSNVGYNTQPNSFGNPGSFSSNYSSSNNQRSDYDLGTSNPVRNYSSQPQDDYSRNTSGSQGLPSLTSNFNSNTSMGSNNARKTSDTIVIRNLPPSCTWQTLRDKFRDIGEVKFAEIRGQDTGVVRFNSERDADRAINLMDGSRFEGRPVEVTYF